MSCWPAATYVAAVTPREAADVPLDRAKSFWAGAPPADAADAADADDPAAAGPAGWGAPAEAAELEASPEQPATAAKTMRITQGTAAAPSRRRREEREENEEPGERAGTARLVRMSLGRCRRAGRLRRQVTIRPRPAPAVFPPGGAEAPRRVRQTGTASFALAAQG
jgi:hypothetical protein